MDLSESRLSWVPRFASEKPAGGRREHRGGQPMLRHYDQKRLRSEKRRQRCEPRAQVHPQVFCNVTQSGGGPLTMSATEISKR